MLPDPDKVYSRSDNGSGEEEEDGDDESNEDYESEDERYDEN